MQRNLDAILMRKITREYRCDFRRDLDAQNRSEYRCNFFMRKLCAQSRSFVPKGGGGSVLGNSNVYVSSPVSPLAGLKWFLAITLWFFNATCWSAWFGYKIQAPRKARDTVVNWLAEYDLSEPEHCGVLYEAYKHWCSRRRDTPLAKYSFYARLVELGAKKFRDGRNGPTKYVMSTR